MLYVTFSEIFGPNDIDFITEKNVRKHDGDIYAHLNL